MKNFEISVEELKQLTKFLEREYISYEFFPLVRLMLRRAKNFLDECNELPNNDRTSV